MSAAALRELHGIATGFHRQHVTSLLYTEPEGRRLLGLSIAPNASDLRVTLDTVGGLGGFDRSGSRAG
ncbi:MAG: hypothetical protein WKF73_14465 [Nocardioidaceae bacterium]